MADVRSPTEEAWCSIGRGPTHRSPGASISIDRERVPVHELDVADVVRGDPRVPQGALDDRPLGEAVRRGDAVRVAVLVGGRSSDHRDDGVAGGECVGQPLQYHDAAAFAAHETVGPMVEGFAAAVGRQHVHARRGDREVRGQHEVDPRSERDVRFPRTEALDREVNGHERRGAGRVHHHRRPVKVEEVGQAARQQVVGRPRAHERVHRVGPKVLQPQVVARVAVGTDEDPGRAAGQALAGLCGVLQGVPRDLEQEPLLRVQAHGLSRRDAEESRVESVDVVQEAAPAGTDLPSGHRVGIVERVDVPSPWGNLPDRIASLAEETPERLRAVRATREAASHAEDRDRLPARGRRRPLPQSPLQKGLLVGRQAGDPPCDVAHLDPSEPSERSRRASSTESCSI
jgi:hypothetical protein